MANEKLTEELIRNLFKKRNSDDKINIEEQQSKNPRINKLLKYASKKGNGKGYPEFIITSENDPSLVVICECKASINKHKSKEGDRYSEYAIDGALLYSSYLSREFNVIAIAASGENKAELTISTFLQVEGELIAKDKEVTEILSFKDYIRLVKESPEKEKADLAKLTKYSRQLHNDLRDHIKLSENEKPLLVSAILIALMDESFRIGYIKKRTAESLTTFLIDTIEDLLKEGKLDETKRDSILHSYRFIQVHPVLKKNPDKLKNLIHDLDNNISPLLDQNLAHDILGQFYGEFLRYTGGDKKGLGIVLTPRHITDLFVELADCKKDDVVLDNCCGTSGFLISAMDKMIKDAKGNSKIEEDIKKNGLIGIEQQANMFTLGCANMILRGDGKANVYHDNCFECMDKIKKKHKCTIGFLNPPYSQKGKGLSELDFINNCLDMLEKNAVCIAIVPMSCVIGKSPLKKKLMENNTLLAVMSMPDELFYPVGVVTCIMVFKKGIPHNSNVETWFGYWKDDGFVKTKKDGRIDLDNRWNGIRKSWLGMYRNNKVIAGKSAKQKVKWNDEWCAEAYMKTDYSKITEEDFIQEMKKYLLFKIMNEDKLKVEEDEES